jgi:sulfite exporter TauE/SafE
VTAAVLFSVFLMALLGGVHCAAMCGGIALAAEAGGRGAVTVVPAIVRRRPRDWIAEQLVMHAGRLLTYMVLGAALGALGAAAWKTQYLPAQRWLFGAGSAMLLVSGLAMLGTGVPGSGLAERLIAMMGRRAGALSMLLRRVSGGAPGNGGGRFARRLGIGLAWGLVPCGMVYGALTLALLAGSAPSGALVMGVFGVGTLPNLLMLSGLSGYLRRLSRRPAFRLGAGATIAIFGAAGVLRAAALPGTLAAHGFCLVF